MNLEDAIRQYDKSDMLRKIREMSNHLADAWKRNADVQIGFRRADCDHLVVAGMGGSAIGGDVMRCVVDDQLTVPVVVSRNYTLPKFVGPRSLVLVSSYSGSTEESLAAFRQALALGAKIVCVTGGGRLRQEAQSAGLPIFELPAGFPPRAALIYLTIPLLQIVSRLGFVGSIDKQVEEAVGVLSELSRVYSPEKISHHNIPLQIAQKITGKIPVVYAASGLLEAAVTRWRGQFSENAEILAYGSLFPEMNHNEIVGWGRQAEIDKELQIIYLRDRDDHPRTKIRMEVTRDIIEKTTNPVLEVWSEGESKLARLVSIIFTGDLASFYAAVLGGVDPTPVRKIDFLKDALAKHN